MHAANEALRYSPGMHPNSHAHMRCRSCASWVRVEDTCSRCGRDPRLLPVALDEPTRECRKCHVHQPISYFRKFKRAPDGLHPWCRPCSSKHSRDLRRHRRALEAMARGNIPSRWKSGQPALSAALEARVWRLLTAAQAAGAAGRWRGRPGIRAYRALREALDEWQVPESEDLLRGEDSPIEEA
jgi:hypothetical protein